MKKFNNIRIRSGISIEKVEQSKISQHQTFAIDNAENRYGPYDLLIVADGARSVVRSPFFFFNFFFSIFCERFNSYIKSYFFSYPLTTAQK